MNAHIPISDGSMRTSAESVHQIYREPSVKCFVIRNINARGHPIIDAVSQATPCARPINMVTILIKIPIEPPKVRVKLRPISKP